MTSKKAKELLNGENPLAKMFLHDSDCNIVVTSVKKCNHPQKGAIVVIEGIPESDLVDTDDAIELTLGLFLGLLDNIEDNTRIHLRAKDNESLLEELLFVCISTDATREAYKVWLESESDNDMQEEIRDLFVYGSEMTELDFYTAMLEGGITVNMVRQYMGDEKADYMEAFCKEHGLI